MFDTPLGGPYVWLGVTAVSLTTLGVTLGLPAAAPPDATAAADAIDEVATSPPGSMSRHGLEASELHVDRRRIGLRGAGGSAHASVAFGPVTDARTDSRLERVLDGRTPPEEFDSPAAFQQVARAARDVNEDWRRAPDELTIRRAIWEGVDVVLVG
jgi:hypothetical protein